MKDTKKITAGILSAALALSLVVAPVHALDASTVGSQTNAITADGTGTSAVKVDIAATQLTATVPTALPMSVDAQGNVTTATDAKIINGSYGAIKVDSIQVAAQNEWTLVASDHDFSKDKVNSKNFNFAIDGIYANADGKVSLAVDSPIALQIDGVNDTDSDERAFTYDGAISAQRAAITDATLANVVFTIDWAQ